MRVVQTFMSSETTGVSYRDEILVSIIRPYSDAVSNDFILMDDNAEQHHARVVNGHLQ